MRISKIFFLPLLALLVSITVTAQRSEYLLQFKNGTELQQFLTYSPKRIPLISAHRGGPVKGFPENALETFANTITVHPAIIECDITLSKDSVLVLMHDDKLDRTSTGTGVIKEQPYAELEKLYLKDNEGTVTSYKIPKLDDVLAWGKNKVIFTLDVKRGVPYARVIEAIRRTKTESCSVIITYNATQAAEVAKLAPDLMISVTVQNKEDLQRLYDNGVPYNRMLAFVGVREADPALYELLHEHKIQCILGTLGNLDRQAEARGDRLYYDMITRGADILSADRTREADAMVNQYREDNKLTSPHIVKRPLRNVQ
ncbi:glycerophosphodiester phosphodiesterase family protein [Sediminibacterium ginsengisoli]|uniref:Glycerophosphoryl diester phosphodiesterase n=1 Tax=Sediminibacterium ginsengisoli TaxID=413434 RepID=A0A1T4K9Q2_9BACT|nr:glycerophosphodiester phosphodiesterase family protein [Sediminibacterium ginsengisoli]SJZ39043.1 glycerophosphoryl diester phosphodiesterase [Sediminibacterium ginsengisoli]